EPRSEALETRAKVAGVLAAMESAGPGRLAEHPQIVDALRRRNEGIADFWFQPLAARNDVTPELAGRKALIIDAEDNFTAMIGHQLRALGLVEDTRRFDASFELDDYDVVVMGPGPGDPCSSDEPRIA